MALGSTCIFEVQSGGNDANSGGFNPGNANFPTDLAATSGTSAAPVVTSASYTFVAGDVGHYVFVQSGTNWTPGWYLITAVNAGAATLDATIGHVVRYKAVTENPINTVAGVATVASPTAGVFGVDYSQNTTTRFTFTDMVIDGTTNTKFTSSGNPVGKNFVGNIINVTSGTGFTVQVVEVVSTVTTTATCDKSLGTLSSSGGNGKLGGCLASTGRASGTCRGQNWILVKQATYTLTSATANVAAGQINLPAGLTGLPTVVMGYGTRRGDLGFSPHNSSQPILKADGVITTFTMFGSTNANTMAINIVFDGNSRAGSTGVSIASTSMAYLCTAKNMVTAGFTNVTNALGSAVYCYTTNCSGNVYNCNTFYCIGDTNLAGDFNTAASANLIHVGCIAMNGSGIGFTVGTDGVVMNCIAYNKAGSGFSSTRTGFIGNCISYGNAASSGFTVSISGTRLTPILYNCAAGANSTDFNTGNVPLVHCVTLTADPFTNAGSGDFSLNNTAGGGAACRGVGISGFYVKTGTPTLMDIGAAQTGSTGGSSAGGGGFLLGG